MQLPSIVTRLITKLIAPPRMDEEQGYNNSPSGVQSTTAVGASSTTWTAAAPVLNRNPRAQETLNEFRHYMGIQNDPDLVQPDRPVPNLGIYQRIVKAEKMYKDQYKIYSTVINSALGLQIIFGAALTALGAGDGPRSAVTAFGAINTVLASVLTFLKGSGLPNRMKYYHNELTKVREYIEQREREFARGEMELDLRAEVVVIEDMYEAVKRDIELNTPDAYVSTTKQNRQPPPPLDRYASAFNREIEDRMHDAEEKYRPVRRGLETRFSQAKLGMEARLADAKHGFNEKINETRAGMDDRITSARYGAESRSSQERLGLENRLSDTKRGMNEKMNETRADLDNRISSARYGVESRLSQERLGLEARIADTKRGFDEKANEARANLDNRISSARYGAESRLSQERIGLESRLSETRLGLSETKRGLNSQIQQSQSQLDDQINTARLATAAQVEDTRHGLESRLEDTRAGVVAQVEDTRHGMESRLKEVQAQVKEQENKIFGIAEKVAEKVLATAQYHRDHERDRT